MFKKLAVAAFAAVFPFTVTAACLGDFGHTNDDHYAYWKDSQGATWVDSQGVCWRTINDESYHNSLKKPWPVVMPSRSTVLSLLVSWSTSTSIRIF